MEQKKLKTYREKLIQKKEEILVAYNKNKTYGKEADEEGSQDIADKASNSYTKEFLFSLSNTERDMLAQVDEAIVRIDDRRFGTCAVCEDELDKKRLEAVPWAKRCISCHDGSNPNLPNLNGYDNVQKVTETDTGTGVFTLVRVSHIHLFGLTFVFFIMGTIFSHAYVRPAWFKCAVIAMPFLSLTLDIGSWYFTKLYHPFAWVVMIAGAGMGLAFAFMWAVSMYQMWLSRPPSVVVRRQESGMTEVG